MWVTALYRVVVWIARPQRMGYVVVCKAKRKCARCLSRFPPVQASDVFKGLRKRRGAGVGIADSGAGGGGCGHANAEGNADSIFG